ncbi:MAG: glycosyltransferase family 39 protein [Nitrospirales bacterium]
MTRSIENNDHTSKLICLGLCLVLVCMAAVLRFSHLGDADFGLDEIFHVYAGQELAKGNPPLLPSGFLYDRGLPYSYLVALAGFLGEFDEFTLRVPSVVCGILVVFFVYWITARWFSAPAGLVAAFLTTFSPIEVALSREVRMYTVFQLLFLLMLFFFYEGYEPSSIKADRSRWPRFQSWCAIYKIRPFFLLLAGITFLLAWQVHKLVQPGVSGIIAYVLALAGIAFVIQKLESPIKQKYIASGAIVIAGVVVAIVLFPEKLSGLIAMTQSTPHFYQERADNWSYYRWELLDEYPMVFGSLTLSLLVCLVKNQKVGLFLSFCFLVPFILHSVILPWKAYRYIFHTLPLMYMVVGVGFTACFSLLWSEGCKLNVDEHVPRMIWHALVVGILCAATLGMLINMPWFMRTIKDYSNDFQTPHFVDVQHHKWKNAMSYIAQHQREGDVLISSYPILTGYYGAKQTQYTLNEVTLRLNRKANLTNDRGNLIDYTFGAEVLQDLEELKKVIMNNPSGWVITYLWRGERYWNHPDRPIPLTGTFPDEVMRYLEANLDRDMIPGSPAIAVWHWSHRGE